ncbi:MAG: F0F1 ATP synthase subunit delta [Dysgonamonadaceae bacterium]|jgi:F-type H+-transporting ATPase subunit delta|nr:F0F1 ATP synthase subunit delta [Dysgonamonadaceae bacterium]
MDSSRISIRYAKAAYEFALENKEETRLYEEMKLLSSHFFAFKLMSRVMENPTVPTAEKEKILITAGGGDAASESYKKLLKLIVGNKRERYVLFIALMYQNWYRKQRGIVVTKLTTTHVISDEIKEKIVRMIAEEAKGDVDLQTVINPDIIGGFVLELDDKQLDASIRSQLVKMKQELVNNNLLKRKTYDV